MLQYTEREEPKINIYDLAHKLVPLDRKSLNPRCGAIYVRQRNDESARIPHDSLTIGLSADLPELLQIFAIDCLNRSVGKCTVGVHGRVVGC